MHLHITHRVGLVNILELNHGSRFGNLNRSNDRRIDCCDFLKCLHNFFDLPSRSVLDVTDLCLRLAGHPFAALHRIRALN
jgi:hypothetical protein